MLPMLLLLIAVAVAVDEPMQLSLLNPWHGRLFSMWLRKFEKFCMIHVDWLTQTHKPKPNERRFWLQADLIERVHGEIPNTEITLLGGKISDPCNSINRLRSHYARFAARQCKWFISFMRACIHSLIHLTATRHAIVRDLSKCVCAYTKECLKCLLIDFIERCARMCIAVVECWWPESVSLDSMRLFTPNAIDGWNKSGHNWNQKQTQRVGVKFFKTYWWALFSTRSSQTLAKKSSRHFPFQSFILIWILPTSHRNYHSTVEQLNWTRLYCLLCLHDGCENPLNVRSNTTTN